MFASLMIPWVLGEYLIREGIICLVFCSGSWSKSSGSSSKIQGMCKFYFFLCVFVVTSTTFEKFGFSKIPTCELRTPSRQHWFVMQIPKLLGSLVSRSIHVLLCQLCQHVCHCSAWESLPVTKYSGSTAVSAAFFGRPCFTAVVSCAMTFLSRSSVAAATAGILLAHFGSLVERRVPLAHAAWGWSPSPMPSPMPMPSPPPSPPAVCGTWGCSAVETVVTVAMSSLLILFTCLFQPSFKEKMFNILKMKPWKNLDIRSTQKKWWKRMWKY